MSLIAQANADIRRRFELDHHQPPGCYMKIKGGFRIISHQNELILHHDAVPEESEHIGWTDWNNWQGITWHLIPEWRLAVKSLAYRLGLPAEDETEDVPF